MRRRASSAAATIRAVEAVSSARLSALAIAVATNSVKLARRVQCPSAGCSSGADAHRSPKATFDGDGGSDR